MKKDERNLSPDGEAADGHHFETFIFRPSAFPPGPPNIPLLGNICLTLIKIIDPVLRKANLTSLSQGK